MSSSTICSIILIHLWLLFLHIYWITAAANEIFSNYYEWENDGRKKGGTDLQEVLHICSGLIISYYGTSSKVCILAFMRKSKICISKLTHIVQRKYVEVDLDGAKTHFT